jgi:hypothetical protein
MGIVEDIIKALERVPAWKRIAVLPAEVAALEERIKALEARLAPATGDQCPRCRELAFALVDTVNAPPPFGDLGLRIDIFRCSSCNYEDRRERPLR